MLGSQRIETMGRLAVVALVVGFVALITQTAVRPMLNAHRNRSAFQGALQTLTDAQVGLDQLDAQIRAVSEEIARNEALLPGEPNLDRFLEGMGETARRTGARVETLTPCELEEHALYRALAIDVRVTGTPAALYDFLRHLEHSQQLSRIERLRVVGKDEQGRCAADLHLTLYFAPSGKG